MAGWRTRGSSAAEPARAAHYSLRGGTPSATGTPRPASTVWGPTWLPGELLWSIGSGPPPSLVAPVSGAARARATCRFSGPANGDAQAYPQGRRPTLPHSSVRSHRPSASMTERSPMAERVVLVCDVCGRPAAASVKFKIVGRSLVKDLCSTHVRELVRNARAPRRGRRPSVTPTATPSKHSGPGSKQRTAAEPQRRRITDPAILERRRAALAKARRALAKKRAAARKAG
jgi:hypothetical protein